MVAGVNLEKKPSKKELKLIEQMTEAGVHFGHSKSRKNPRMNPYISTVKNNISIIELVSTIEKLNEAAEFIGGMVKKGGTILFVGTQPQAKRIVEEIAKDCNMPYVVERWLGGTLTNFRTIRCRVEYLLDLEKKKKAGELGKYTKKEQMLFDEEIEKLNKNLGGIKQLNKLPDVVFVLSLKNNLAAVNEATRKKIPIIGLADTDTDPTLVDYPIPSNDEAISALKFILEKIKEVIMKNQGKT